MLLGSCVKSIARATHGLQHRMIEIFIDFAAQAADLYVDDIGLRVEVIIPHIFQQHSARDHLSGVTHEVFQQAKLARLQINALAFTGNFAFQQIEFQIANVQQGRCVFRVRAAYQCFETASTIRPSWNRLVQRLPPPRTYFAMQSTCADEEDYTQ